MMSLCNMNFDPNTAGREVQCNWDGKKNLNNPGSSFVSVGLTKYARQSPDILDLASSPSFGDTASRRLKNNLILRMLVEQICCKGGFYISSSNTPYYCSRNNVSSAKELQLAAALDLFLSNILQPRPCYPTIKVL